MGECGADLGTPISKVSKDIDCHSLKELHVVGQPVPLLRCHWQHTQSAIHRNVGPTRAIVSKVICYGRHPASPCGCHVTAAPDRARLGTKCPPLEARLVVLLYLRSGICNQCARTQWVIDNGVRTAERCRSM